MQAKPTLFVSLAVAIAILAAIALQVDLARSAAVALSVGWGMLWISLFRLLPIGCDAQDWRAVVPAGAATGRLHMWAARWVGEAVNTLLPAAPAAASVVVDFTLGLAVQAAFAIFVTGLLVARVGAVDGVGATALALVAAAVLFGLFYRAQARGLIAGSAGVLARLAGARVGAIVASAGEVDRLVRALYRDRARLTGCAIWRLVGWFVRAGEVWLIGQFMGLPIGPVEALIIEGLSHAVRSAAFLLPGALGAQEAGILGVCLMLGMPAETGLAVALVKRVRELAVGLPGLLCWAVLERQRGAGDSVAGHRGAPT